MGQPRATICHLLHSLQVGGAEVLAARLARRLQESFRFVFACLDELGTLGQQLQAEGFAVSVLKRRPGVDWSFAWRLAKLLRREQVGLVHAHQYTPFFYGMIARLLCRRPAVLFTEHGRHYPDYPRRKRILLNRLLLERRDHVLGVGQAVRQALIQNEGFPGERVGVIYNGIDLSGIGFGSPNRELIRRNVFGVGPDAFVVIQVARLDYLKDHATAIRTLEHVVQRHSNTQLVLVGEGPEKDKISQLVEQRKLTTHVRFLGLRTDVGQLLPAADLFLLTSISEGIPLTLIEAMAAELPVVATRVGGVGEVVEEERTGLLAPAGDNAALAKCILRLIDQPALRKEMGQAGRERSRAVFSESRMHAEYFELYQKMLNE